MALSAPYLPYFDAEREKADPKNQLIPEKIAAVLAAIDKHENYILPVTEMDRMICEGYYRSSGRDRTRPTVTRSEKIVFATDACIGCGVCTSVCPHGSWKVVDGHSVAEGECENCLACVHAEGHLHHPDPSGAGGAEPERALPQSERELGRPDQGEQSDLISKIYEEEIVDGSRIRPHWFSCDRPALDDAPSRSRQ